MFHIAIIDDELYARNRLLDIIEKELFHSNLDYRISQFINATDFFNSKNIEYDVVFLDIELGEDNGLMISKVMYEREMKPIVIFVTAYEGYIKNAFGLNVYGYIMKDEVEERIPEILKKILQDLNRKSYIILKNDMGPTTYRYSEIVYFMIEDRNCYVQTIKEKVRIHASTLKGIKAELNDQFLQPNAKYIVNAKHIKSIENGAIILDNDECIFISRGKVRKFNEQYKDFLMNEV